MISACDKSGPFYSLSEDPTAIPFDQLDPVTLVAQVQELLAHAHAELKAIEDHHGADLGLFGRLDLLISRVRLAQSLTLHLTTTGCDPAMATACRKVQPKLTSFLDTFYFRVGIFEAIARAASASGFADLLPAHRAYAAALLRDFERKGVALPDDKKTRLQTLDNEIAEQTSLFSRNVIESVKTFELLVTHTNSLDGLPDSSIEAAREAARDRSLTGWCFTLHAPSCFPALLYAHDRQLRERLWRGRTTRGCQGSPDNRVAVLGILRARREKAELLGYKDFADLALADSMAGNGAAAQTFVTGLEKAFRKAFEAENRALVEFARDNGSYKELMPWDIDYWAERYRQATCRFTLEQLRPYFSLANVKQGLFDLTYRLFGLRVVRREDLPTWHPDVCAYELHEGSSSPLATFYMDLLARDGKRGGAWMNGLAVGVPNGTGSKRGLAVICANFAGPAGGKPTLLSHEEVRFLFHEFGHLLHHCLSEVEIQSLGGTKVVRDIVELPSQLFENWCWERAPLDLIARHYLTGERLPEILVEKLQETRKFRAANTTMQQLGLAAVDLALHINFDPFVDKDPIGFARDILGHYSPVALPTDSASIASFNHIFGEGLPYAASYYSYKWAEVLEADVFNVFQEHGIMNTAVANRFRRFFLAQGRLAAPDEVFRAFVGRDPSPAALLSRLGIGA